MIIRIFSTLILLWMVGFAWFAIFMARPLDGQKTEAIIVLTGGGERIERALDVLREGWGERLLISGVDREVLRPELVAQYPDDAQLFGCCVDLGFAAEDTRSNALESARWLAKGEYRSVRLITDNWHMHRARFEMERVLPDDVKLYADAVAATPSLQTLFLEYHKYLLRRAGALTGI